MLEKQAVRKREDGFDRIETIAMMHEEIVRRLHVGFDPGPVYIILYNARRPPTLEELVSLDIKVEVERLRMGIFLLEPPPPQYNLRPRARR